MGSTSAKLQQRAATFLDGSTSTMAIMANGYGCSSSYKGPHGLQSYTINIIGITGIIGIIVAVQWNPLDGICSIKSLNGIYLMESLDGTQWNLLDGIFSMESAQGKTLRSGIRSINPLNRILLESAQCWNMLDEIISIEFV